MFANKGAVHMNKIDRQTDWLTNKQRHRWIDKAALNVPLDT